MHQCTVHRALDTHITHTRMWYVYSAKHAITKISLLVTAAADAALWLHPEQ